jgi:hypothetical protein
MKLGHLALNVVWGIDDLVCGQIPFCLDVLCEHWLCLLSVLKFRLRLIKLDGLIACASSSNQLRTIPLC